MNNWPTAPEVASPEKLDAGLTLFVQVRNRTLGFVLAVMAIDFRDKRELGALGRIGKALREDLEMLRQRPAPERWVDLLNRLNEEEQRPKPRHDNPRP